MKKQKNNVIRELLNPKTYAYAGLITMLSFVVSALVVLAADTTQFSQSISGALDVAIVDGSGNAVASPSVAFPAKSFSMTYQSSVATLGTASEKMRVTNPSGATDVWTLSMAATNGATATWSNGVNTYDFNDATASAGDGADADSVGGQMTIDPSAGTIEGAGGTTIANVSKGTADAFVQGSTDSIDLMSAAAGAAKPGQWDLTGVAMTQTIPGAQATGSYAIDMTVTAV